MLTLVSAGAEPCGALWCSDGQQGHSSAAPQAQTCLSHCLDFMCLALLMLSDGEVAHWLAPTTQGPEHLLLPLPALLEWMAKGKRELLEVAVEQK